jgi:hypothetical protein
MQLVATPDTDCYFWFWPPFVQGHVIPFMLVTCLWNLFSLCLSCLILACSYKYLEMLSLLRFIGEEGPHRSIMLSTRQHSACSRNIQHNFSMKYMFECSKSFSLERPITRFQQIKQSLLQVKSVNPTHYSTYIITSLLFWAEFRRGLWTVLTPGKQFDSKFHPVPNTLTGRLAQMIWIPSCPQIWCA